MSGKNFKNKKYSISLAIFLSLFLISCSGGGSSNGGRGRENPNPIETQQECSDEFGDASRCDVREQL